MGKQSARIYFQGKDHKDIYFQGHYHDRMYIGSQLVWEKLKGLLYKTYYHSYYLSDSMWAENGNVAVFIGPDQYQIYVTSDFITVQKSDTRFPKGIKQIACLNGIFYLLSDGRYYSSEDGLTWEKIQVLIFHTNGFSGTIDTDLRNRARTFFIANGIAYAGFENYTDEYVDRPPTQTNDYAHELSGTYKSTDFKTWTSLNTLYYTYTNSYGVMQVMVYSSYGLNNLHGYNGKYFFNAFESYIKDGALYSKPLGLYSSEDMSTLSVIQENINTVNTTIAKVGNNKFHAMINGTNMGITEDFISYDHNYFDQTGKSVTDSNGTVHSFSFKDNEVKNGIEYGDYLFSNVKTDSGYCTVVSDKNNYGKVADIINGIVTDYYDYSTGEKGYGVITTNRNRICYITGKNLVVSAFESTSLSLGISIISLEEQ